MKYHLDQNKNAVQTKRHVAEVMIENGGYTVGHRDDGGIRKSGLGVQRKSQCQNEESQKVKEYTEQNTSVVFFQINPSCYRNVVPSRPRMVEEKHTNGSTAAKEISISRTKQTK